jgi:hypothetical protein
MEIGVGELLLDRPEDVRNPRWYAATDVVRVKLSCGEARYIHLRRQDDPFDQIGDVQEVALLTTVAERGGSPHFRHPARIGDRHRALLAGAVDDERSKPIDAQNPPARLEFGDLA